MGHKQLAELTCSSSIGCAAAGIDPAVGISAMLKQQLHERGRRPAPRHAARLPEVRWYHRASWDRHRGPGEV